jgi:F-type H+-transporting ATPase subunit alpha
LRVHGAMDYTIVVVATGEDPAGLQFAAPYAAMTMAEYFMERGRDALVVIDDLTRHARAYRELSLLLRRPPGREAYPGDIFYIHSRLLERSTHLRPEYGGGSLTALPIIETQAQNISAYIPTNLISITDGQIYLSPNLFQRGILPAVDVGRSVSRVGGDAQLPAYRAVAGDLRLSYSQFQEMEAFARFGTRLEEETRKIIERGRRVREVLKQRQFDPIPVAQQIAVLLAATEGVFDILPLDQVGQAEEKLRETVGQELPDVYGRIQSGAQLKEDDQEALLSLARQTVEAMQERERG